MSLDITYLLLPSIIYLKLILLLIYYDRIKEFEGASDAMGQLLKYRTKCNLMTKCQVIMI